MSIWSHWWESRSGPTGPVLDHRLEPHDANQLELKLHYLIEPGRRRERYRVETFMFVSRTLGLDATTYPKADFYADTAAFLRFKTPQVPLDELADADQARAWFSRVTDHLAARDPAAAVRALKTLGCVYRAALRDALPPLVERAEALAELVGASEREADEAELAQAIEALLAATRPALSRLEALRQACAVDAGDDAVVDAWEAVDEYVWLVAEDVLTEVVAALDELAFERGPRLAGAVEATIDLALEAYQHRRERGYPSYVEQGEANEAFPYRRRLLKRTVYSALYLDVRQEDGGRLTRDVIGMLAAAAAMLFAVLVAIWAQREWSMVSGPFIAVMVVSYMIKDRIKEWGKTYLGRRSARLLPDKVVQIRHGPGGPVIGRCRESVRVVRRHDVDPEILQARHLRHGVVARSARPETVVHYTKDVAIDRGALAAEEGHVEGLNDIIRFNLQRLRRRMDVPTEVHVHLHPKTRELVAVPCERVYHVNFVLRLTVGDGARRAPVLERVKVIMDQRGIKRVEFIPLSDSAQPVTEVLAVARRGDV